MTSEKIIYMQKTAKNFQTMQGFSVSCSIIVIASEICAFGLPAARLPLLVFPKKRGEKHGISGALDERSYE